MPVSLLCQQWHGRLKQPRLAAARDVRPGWPLQKVWPGVQRRQVTHNDMPNRSIMVGDVGGGHGAEVQRGGRLVPVDTAKAGSMPGVWS